jgi:hypothetical protein
MADTSTDGWEEVDNNYTNPLNSSKSMEDFQKEVEILREKYVKPNLWDKMK